MRSVVILARELIVADAEDRIAAERLAADGAPRALLDLARLLGEASDAMLLATRLTQVEPTDDADACGLLVAACFGALSQDYVSRQDAVAMRASIAARADQVYATAGSRSAELLDWLLRLAGETVRQLSAIAADRAPLVRVETGLSLPSSVLAWGLYADPARGEELVERNRSATPMVMPATIEAVAP